MKTYKKIFWYCLSVAFLLHLHVMVASARPPVGSDLPPFDSLHGGPQPMPLPVTVDQVTHNKGNIITTIDNWGYIGGYSYYGLPSGEWPRNSGCDYLAEIRYWMGAVTTGNDTLVANTYDDFQAIEALSSADNPYQILLSTDTTRYYDYDLSDTVGLGVGHPAYGWRVWSDSLSDWVYNRVYAPLDSVFLSGGPTSLQESHYRFNDAASGSSLLGLEMTQTVLQWNYCYNEDFLFVILEIANTSTQDYDDFAFGLYIDIDVGGPDGTGENGRLKDKVASDSTENLAWIYDSVGVDPGWGPTVTTGIMGTKLLETPDDIGMTAFRSDDWAVLPHDDPERFAFINSAQYDTSLGATDQFYLQCVRGINLTAGKTVRVVYALVAGADEEDFRDNASLAQQLYDNHFVGPQPPPTPRLRAKAVDEKVYLYWDDTSEVGLDPLSGTNDFVGYKLYRSDNQGKTWGVPNYQTNNNCLDIDYSTLALYTVNTPGDPIPRSFIDVGLYNGVEYWYCLVAFDAGDTVAGVDALQSGFGIAGEVSNVVAVTPVNNPAGYYEAAGTVVHDYFGVDTPSDGDVIPMVFDRDSLQCAQYRVVFEDTPEQTYWHLINETTGDTVLATQTITNEDPGMYEIVEGLRVVVTNGDRVPARMQQTGVATEEGTLAPDPDAFYGTATGYFFGVEFGDEHCRSNYEIRYTSEVTHAGAVNDPYGLVYDIPLEIWNTTTDERVSFSLYDFGEGDGVFDPWDLLIAVNYPYDPGNDVFDVAWPYYFNWFFGLDYENYNPSEGDVLTIEGAPLNSPEDNFAFKVVYGVNAATAAVNLKDIRVVPNPYFAQYSAMIETGEGESVVEFQNIPDRCTIRIYTLAGDLVETINHNDGTGAARWDLLSEHGRLVASGIYIYHVESPYGEHLGRFAIIK